MKILITGGAGFIGSHLSEELLRHGNSVVVLDNFSTGRHENITHLENNPAFKLIKGDILDYKLVEKAAEDVDKIFHLAASVGVELVVKHPLESLHTNIRGSEILLDIAAHYNKRIMVVSSSEIYGKNINGPLKEDDDRILGSPLKTRWGYATAKAVDEMLAHIYFKDKGLPTVIVRLFNTVGPRQTGAYGMVLPRFVKQALTNEPLTVFGSGKQTRCFLHVKDAVWAMTKLMEAPAATGEVFNVGSQEEISIEDLAKKIIEISRSNSKIVYIPYHQAYEEGFEDMPRRVPDITKIFQLIGFKPTVRLDGIIRDVIDYFSQEGSRQ
jgi:UDP-glucose 4-epimerase